MSSTTRILLIKPGDVLLIGNTGQLYETQSTEDTQHLAAVIEAFKDALGIKAVFLFEEDIDIAALPADEP